jgi:transcriptional regulator with XRE-family HTH domain
MATHFAKQLPEAKRLRREAGVWLKELRARAGMSQIDLAGRLGLKYYTFISQVENGFGRVPTESMEAWAVALDVEPSAFARKLLAFYDPELYRLLFEVKS